jgi:hypothetical protein
MLNGEVKKHAVIKTHFGTPSFPGGSGNSEQKGHSISPSSRCPQRSHLVALNASSIS